jgi:DNA ligase D-like protein (predicted polymerase)
VVNYERMRIGRRDVALTNLDKVCFPGTGLTKGDLVAYYLDLAPFALNHVERRPMQMKRYPHGVGGDFFYQKRVPTPHPDWLETVRILFPGSGRTADFPVVTDAASLAWIVNLGCIELHTWHARVTDVERPDYMLIDLDPSEGNPWELVPEIAMVVKEVLDELDLPGFPKTSGATGFHILTPIRTELRFPEVRRFAKALAQEVERRVGDQDVATTTWKVADRSGVFVDYGQNARDRTIASAYSIRPTPDARASAPLRWEEVPRVDPGAFTMQTMRDRVAKVGDLTKGMWRRKGEPWHPGLTFSGWKRHSFRSRPSGRANGATEAKCPGGEEYNRSVILLYPALLIGAVVVAVRRREYAGGRGWLWFAVWLATGMLFTFSLATGFSVGLLILPLVAVALLGVAWLSPHLREASGLVVGAASFVVAVAVLL